MINSEILTLDQLRNQAANIGPRGHDTAAVARRAVQAGLFLIGTTESVPVHRPQDTDGKHYYRDLHTLDALDFREYPEERDDVPYLQIGTNVETAIMCALFGNVNLIEQRKARCMPITKLWAEQAGYGWGTDASKTIRALTLERPIPRFVVEEESLIRTHADPRLVSEALCPDDPTKPLVGFIDVVADPGKENRIRIAHELGQCITQSECETLFTIPVAGYDLPRDLGPTVYTNPDSIRNHYV